MVPIIPALSILSALGIVVVLDVLRVLLPKQLTPVIVSAVSVMLVGTIITAGLWNYFVDVQAAYPPPDTANVISFAALDLRAPCQFVYVYNASQKKALVPWVLLHMPTEATYQGISRDDIATGRYTINANGCYEIFFEPQNTDIVNQFIERTTDRQVKPNTYFDKQRNIITLSYAFECQLQKCYLQ
jgi:hypothetical protein